MAYRRTKGGLTWYESRILRMIRRGPKTYRDRDRPEYIVFECPGVKTFQTREFMIARLQGRRLIAAGDNMLRLELTTEGIAALDGSLHEGKPQLPAGLLGSARTKAMAKLLDLRREGFADPVDALLAIAYETDEAGEWKHPIEIRIQCLTAAAPYCKPKLQAIIAKVMDAGKSHAEWLMDLKEEIDGPGDGVIDGRAEVVQDCEQPLGGSDPPGDDDLQPGPVGDPGDPT